jgi:hypothetical protein
MLNRGRMLRTVLGLAVTATSVVALAGCGGSSQSAVGLLKQTFCGQHSVKSGNLNVALTVMPSGSQTLKGPISLSLSGPFQSLGAGKLPKSDLTIALSALGNSTSVGIISTGSHGYVTFSGSNYRLPQTSFQRLESSFSSFASPPGCTSKTGVLSKLRIRPLHWLTNPQVVGTETVGGAQATHIHAGINVSALLGDLSSFLQQAPGLGGSGGSTGLSQSALTAIAAEIQNPSLDVWTGTSDKALRKLNIHLTIPVTGQISTLLGGLRSAGIGLSMQYGDLNQPQTVTAPTNLQPYSQFQTKLGELFSAVRSQLSGALSGGLSSSGAGTTGSTGSGNYQAYSQCIQAAGGDVSKMQNCAPLLTKGK